MRGVIILAVFYTGQFAVLLTVLRVPLAHSALININGLDEILL